MALPLFRGMQKCVCQKRKLHTTSSYMSLFYERDDREGMFIKSDEQVAWEKMTFMEKVKHELKLFKRECKFAGRVLKERVTKDPNWIYRPDEVDAVLKFRGEPDELKKWVVTSDKDHDLGHSTAYLEYTNDLKGLFHGFLDTRIPKDGKHKHTGYCNIKSVPILKPFGFRDSYDWTQYTHLVFRIRGDGRVYAINLYTTREFDVTRYDQYHYFIWTRGGPYWQTVRIPFSRFFFGYKGRIQQGQEPFYLDEINSLGFTIADKITGPFRLEIDYIGVVNDPSHLEKSAYELYQDHDPKIWY